MEVLWKVTVLIRPKLCGNCAFPQNFQTRKLGEIKVFTQWLQLQLERRIPSTRITWRILVQFEDLREYKEIRAAILAFAENIGKILFCATNKNYDDEGCILYEAPYIIRSFKMKINIVDGLFAEKIPQFLETFIQKNSSTL